MVSPNDGRMHDMKRAGVPESPWDELVSGLYVGSSEMEYPGENFAAVVSVFDWHYDRLSWLPAKGTPHLVMPFHDAKYVPEKQYMESIADFIGLFHVKDHKVLVRCQAGLNRSSLAAGYYMCSRLGFTGDEFIEIVRRERDKQCLFNQVFAAYLRREFP